MPALSLSDVADSTILVTGGSGYIGAWVIETLLTRGFRVRAVLRSEAGADTFMNCFPQHIESGRLTYVIVPQFYKEGAFDDVLGGVDAVAHIASPVQWETGTFEELAQSAVDGSYQLLKSTQRAGARVKRVVYTSSTGAIHSGKGNFTENDWNDEAIARASDPSAHPDFHPIDRYIASKTLAERACFDFVQNNNVSFDLVTVLPTYTFGPVIHHVPSFDKLGSSPAIFANGLRPGLSPSEIKRIISTVVDVRDVAELHLLALFSEKAGGARLVAASEPFCWQRIYDILRAEKDPPFPESIPIGTPGAYDEPLSTLSTQKVQEVFPDFRFRALEETVQDAGRQVVARGWLLL